MNIILKLTEKLYLVIYQITIVFALFFYVLLKAATGHKFSITNEELVYLIIFLISSVFCGFFKEKEKFSDTFNLVVNYVLLVFTVLTFLMALNFLFYSITFDYEFRESPIMISIIGFILPIIFIWCNLYLIKRILREIINITQKQK